MNGFGIEVSDLTVRYGDTVALDAASFTVRPGTITGLLGRNGSGKTTALSVVAAFRGVGSGTVRVDGVDPWEDERVLAGTCLIRESGDVVTDATLAENIDLVEQSRPHFSRELAESLMDRFELDPKKKPVKLSRGKKSAFGVLVGLASRAELTLLDEVHLGMDAPTRYAFYDTLLADYLEHPRTIVISSHLIDEVERLLEDVVVLDRGRVLLAQDVDTLRAQGLSVTGSADAVERFVAGRTVLSRQRLGGTAQAMVRGAVDDTDVERARSAGLELGPVALQDLFVHLTDPTGPSADGVPARHAKEDVR